MDKPEQIPEKEIAQSFLESKKTIIDLDNPVELDLNISENILQETEFFLSGETHAVKNSLLIKYYIFEYLHKKVKLKYICAEVGYSIGMFINKYLETSDTLFLNIIAQ